MSRRTVSPAATLASINETAIIDEVDAPSGNVEIGVTDRPIARIHAADTSIPRTASSEQAIRDLIYTVRGMQVMLDSDLAMLYGVETGALNRAAKRNESRFPEDFRFQIKRSELFDLRCQIGILRGQNPESSVGRTYMPYVYTEMGVAMLASVLRSETATRVSVQIVRAFVEMRHFIASNDAMFEQIRAVELRQLEYQRSTDERFERVFDYMEAHESPKQKLFFDGMVYDAFELLTSLVRKAMKSIVLIDGYVDDRTLNILAKKAKGVDAIIWTRPNTPLTQFDIDAFNAQYPMLTIEHTTTVHDRVLILDGTEGYLVGASLKDAGKKCFAITRIEDENTVTDLLERLRKKRPD